MRTLLPPPDDGSDGSVDAAAVAARYLADPRPRPIDRPWVAVNMIATLDGATAVDGVSGPLGGPGDKVVFTALRSIPDAILVAAGTARAERYGPVRLSDDRREARVARGQRPVPQLVIVSGSLDLDLSLPVFGAGEPPIVLTGERADPDRRAAIARVARVETMGDDRVDLVAATAWLGEELGADVVLCEGGPSLNGAMVAAGLVDEWCLTIAPMLVSGDAARAAHGPVASLHGLTIDHLLEDEGWLFVRASRR